MCMPSYFVCLFTVIGVIGASTSTLCLSHQQTNAYIGKLGEGHDAEVLSWRDDILSSMRGANGQECQSNDEV